MPAQAIGEGIGVELERQGDIEPPTTGRKKGRSGIGEAIFGDPLPGVADRFTGLFRERLVTGY